MRSLNEVCPQREKLMTGLSRPVTLESGCHKSEKISAQRDLQIVRLEYDNICETVRLSYLPTGRLALWVFAQAPSGDISVPAF